MITIIINYCKYPSAAPPISVTVSANLTPPLTVGQTGLTLTCDVSGADNLNLMMIYEWNKNNETIPAGNNSNTLTLSPLRLLHAGSYSCSITSTLLNNPGPISATNQQNVVIQSKSKINNYNSLHA